MLDSECATIRLTVPQHLVARVMLLFGADRIHRSPSFRWWPSASRPQPNRPDLRETVAHERAGREARNNRRVTHEQTNQTRRHGWETPRPPNPCARRHPGRPRLPAHPGNGAGEASADYGLDERGNDDRAYCRAAGLTPRPHKHRAPHRPSSRHRPRHCGPRAHQEGDYPGRTGPRTHAAPPFRQQRRSVLLSE